MKKNYSDLLKSPKWQKKRLEIMKRDKFTCKLCGDTETQLHVHHKKYISGNDPWDYDNKLLVTLCEDCHETVESCKIQFIRWSKEFDLCKLKVFKIKNNRSQIEVIDYNKQGIVVVITDITGYKSYFDFSKDQSLQLIKYLQK